MGRSAQATNYDAEKLRTQLTERVRSTLVAQKRLGAVENAATYTLEVELGTRELYGFGKGLPFGLALETGILLAGAGIGGFVGWTIDNGARRDSLTAITSASLGIAVAAPLAFLAAYATDSSRVRGEYTASLTLRRRSDRVPVATRRLISSWKADYSAFGAEQKVAKFAGDAVPEFERVLVEGVKSMLLELNEPLAAAP